MAKKYSKIYKVGGWPLRYNYEQALLELVYDWDLDDDGNKVPLAEPDVLDAVGLSRENWKDDRQYWLERYAADLNEEVGHLASDIV